jgi:flagellin-like hook-associated protein FlgL
MRSNLFSLQNTAEMMTQTQAKLSTGLKVNSALDNPSAYFAAQNHTQRAGMLEARKDAIGEAIQTVKKADTGITAVSKLLDTARGLVASARSAIGDATKMGALSTQYNSLMSQIDNIVTDSDYNGVNLLDSDSLAVAFNEDNTTNINLAGFDANNGTATVTATDVTWDGATDAAALDTVETAIFTSQSNLNSEASKLASSMAVLSTRNTFIDSTVNTLLEGAGKLTNADVNEEAANLLALQTRSQLGTTAMSMSSQMAQSVLRLF